MNGYGKLLMKIYYPLMGWRLTGVGGWRAAAHHWVGPGGGIEELLVFENEEDYDK